MFSYGPPLSARPSPRGFEGAQFPCTDDCQVTFVNLKCDSSKKRRRGRKSPNKEVSHITAEFEVEMKEEETSGVLLLHGHGEKEAMAEYKETPASLSACLAAQTPAMWTACARR